MCLPLALVILLSLKSGLQLNVNHVSVFIPSNGDSLNASPGKSPIGFRFSRLPRSCRSHMPFLAKRPSVADPRGTTAERGYAHGWPKVRSAKLAADPICEIRICCQGMVATEVDHIIPITKRPDLRLEWSNLQSACKPCNVAKARGKRRKTDEIASVFVAI